MKYITEEELRSLYNEQAFETYTLTTDVKLTPGGRQFLVDRKIPMIAQGEQKARKTVSLTTDQGNCMDVHFALLEAIFMQKARELFERNQALANQIYDLKDCLQSIACGRDAPSTGPQPCGREKEQLKYLDFQIGREELFSERGKDAACLRLLQCELGKFYTEHGDFLSANQKNHLFDLINRLLQMIHITLGSDLCQRDVMK